jgi:hypothetical protein
METGEEGTFRDIERFVNDAWLLSNVFTVCCDKQLMVKLDNW